MVKKTVVFPKDVYVYVLKRVQEELLDCEKCLSPDFVDYDELGQPFYNWQVERRDEAAASLPVLKKLYECLLGIDED